jgi:hypothetical protein
MRKIDLRERMLFIFLTGFFLFLFTYCGGKDTKKGSEGVDLGDAEKRDNIIMTVEDSIYFNSDFKKYVSVIFGDDLSDLTVISLSRLFDNFMEEKILLQAAKNKNISLTWQEKEEYLAKLSDELRAEGNKAQEEEMNTNVLFDKLLVEKYAYEFVKSIEVKEGEIKEYYKLHKRDFFQPERIRVSQILLKTENKAIEILERVKTSTEESFRKIVREESTGLEADKGGEMGVFEMGQLPFEMEKVIFALDEGEISSILSSVYGFHIFRLDKRYESVLISESNASSKIKVMILDQKIKQLFSMHIEELEKNMEWNFYLENLTFPYQRNDR